MNCTDEQIIKALNSADLFLRNRANAKPAPLNKYDIAELLDIANVCVNTLDLIKRLKAENERLEAQHREMCIGMKVIKRKARKELAERFREKASSSVMSCQGYEIYETKQYQISAVDFDNILKEMEQEEEIKNKLIELLDGANVQINSKE